MNARKRLSILLGTVGTLAALIMVGCNEAESSAEPAGIDPKVVADSLFTVMEADRAVYTKKVVKRVKSHKAIDVVEEWEDSGDEHLPLPAQMFRMGAELVNENAEAGFTYSLKSQWPLNPQNEAVGTEIEGLKYIAEHPDENFYKEEEIGGKKFFTAVYAASHG